VKSGNLVEDNDGCDYFGGDGRHVVESPIPVGATPAGLDSSIETFHDVASRHMGLVKAGLRSAGCSMEGGRHQPRL
jgi:hypothetical protein